MQALAKGEPSKSDGAVPSDKRDAKTKQEKADDTDSSVTPTQERQGSSKKTGDVTIPSGHHSTPKRESVNNVQSSSHASEATNGRRQGPVFDNVNESIPMARALSDISGNRANDTHLSGIGIHAPAPAAWTTMQAPESITCQAPSGSQQMMSIRSDMGCSSGESWLQDQGTNAQPFPSDLYHHSNDAVPMSASLPTHLSYGQHHFSPFTTVHSQALAEQQHEYCPSEQADEAAQSPDSEKSPGRAVSPFSRRERRIDLAARRKRPRPAAIGTTGLGRSLLGPSSMSPTTRLPTNVGHGLRHVKSTQNLGSNLSPRYPGVRKTSATLRSPLAFPSSFEPSIPNMTSTELTVPPLLTTTMAPPTPLTPEDIQYFLPRTPNDAQFCPSPSQDMSGSGWCSTTQSLPLYVHSPPATPLHPTLAPHLQYQTSSAPVSVPSQHTIFNHGSISEQPGSMGPATWAIGPDEVIQMPQPVHISPVPFEGSVMEDIKHVPGQMSIDASSQHGLYHHNSHTPPNAMSTDDTTPPGTKPAEFLIQEFPQQQEAHRFAAQQFSSHGPRTYTFNHQTPSSF